MHLVMDHFFGRQHVIQMSIQRGVLDSSPFGVPLNAQLLQFSLQFKYSPWALIDFVKMHRVVYLSTNSFRQLKNGRRKQLEIFPSGCRHPVLIRTVCKKRRSEAIDCHFGHFWSRNSSSKTSHEMTSSKAPSDPEKLDIGLQIGIGNNK